VLALGELVAARGQHGRCGHPKRVSSVWRERDRSTERIRVVPEDRILCEHVTALVLLLFL
jgi:hypothetical protein